MRAWISVLTTLGLAAAIGSLALAQEPASDEEAIDQLGERFKEAWNGRDAGGLAAMYTEDADEINERGETFSGRAAIQANLEEAWEMMGEGAALDFEVTHRRFITEDLAVEDGTWELTGLPEMEQAPPSSGLYTVYLVKQDEGWRITAGRTRIAMEPPSTEE